MNTTLGTIRQLVAEVLLHEFNAPRGKLRPSSGKKQYNPGKVEDQNSELSTIEAERMFPGSTDAWAEVVPDMFPDYPFDDPEVIKAKSSWFRIGKELRVTFSDTPQIELARWDASMDDWIPLEPGE